MRPPGPRPLRARAIAIAATILASLLAAVASRAATHRVPAEPGALARAVARAAPGDTLLLASGIHRGGAVVDRRLSLVGEPGAIVDGGGAGSVLRVGASGTTIARLSIRGSGPKPLTIDSGIYVQNAAGVVISEVAMEDVLYGVAAERSDSLRIEGCSLRGRASPTGGVKTGLQASEGNGVHLWYCHGAVVEKNRVTRFVDAIYLSFAFRARIEENLLWDNGRYGLHTMYNQENQLLRNRFTRNVAGCALMFSNRLVVEGNDFVQNQGARTYGLLLRDCSDGLFVRNRMMQNTVAVFLDGSNRNRFRENLVQDNGWGILLFSSCDDNEFARNNFWNNDYPVALDMRRSDNRFDDGRTGNFWSEHAGYDLDGDGVSDIPHAPVTAFAFLSKQFPDLAIFGQSPATAALTMAERTIPALRPSEIVDRFPLVAPVAAAPAAPTPAPPAGTDTRGRAAAVVGFGALAMAGLAGLARRS
jgi:nitrous oxidase accessory protein